MTNQTIEQAVEEIVRTVKSREFSPGVPVNLPSEYKPDLRGVARKALQTQRDAGAIEERERMVGKIKCGECNGSGEYSSPSDYDPCLHCEGTGVYIDGSLNDVISSLDKEISPKE